MSNLSRVLTVGICDIKNAHFHSFFTFNAIHLKFCKTLYLLNGQAYFNFFPLLTSLWWVLSETIIRYPIILKAKFGRNFVTSFSHRKRQNLKKKKKKTTKDTFFWNGEFYIIANFQVNCGKTKKRWIKVSIFDVTYAHPALTVSVSLQIRESRIQFGECSVCLTEQIVILLTSWSCNKKDWMTSILWSVRLWWL